MKYLLGSALLGTAALASPAHADFQLAPTQMVAGPAMRDEARPLRLSPVSQDQTRPPAPAPAKPRGLPVAYGFGQQVPLAFATRQIVPARVEVTFGPGVDEAAPVDWTGGRPWDEALRAAVRPLGLRVVVRWMAVSIVRS